MVETTLCFPVLGNPPRKVLLGLKKRGVGTEKYYGFGGKVEFGESIEDAVLRELEEESGLVVAKTALENRGFITFLPELSRAHLYLVQEWAGKPQETEEMKPEWFEIEHVPYDKMWRTDREWIPRVLAGERIELEIVTTVNGKRRCKFVTDSETQCKLKEGKKK